MFESELQARTLAQAALTGVPQQAQFRTVKITESTDLATGDELDVTSPGRSQAITAVSPVAGIAPVELIKNTQVLMLDGPTPQRIGRSPWITSNLT